MTAKKTTTEAKAAKPTTVFRVHYRTSEDDKRHTMDVAAADVGGAHEKVRASVAEGVRVFIDKTKAKTNG